MKNSFFSEEKTVVLLSSYIITYIYYTYNFVYNLCSSRLKKQKKVQFWEEPQHSISSTDKNNFIPEDAK